MRILHVISSVNPAYGGPIEGIRQLHVAMLNLGHVTEVACLDAPEAPWLEQAVFPVYPLGPGKTSYTYGSRLVPWLRERAKDYNYIIVNGIWQYSAFGAWRALHGTQTPYLVYTHGMLDPYFKQRYPLKHLKKMLFWPWAEYRLLRDALAVCFTSEEEKRLARQSFRPYRCNELVVNYGTAIPTGDPEAQRSAFLSAFPMLAGRRMLLFLSRIHPKKGCDLLIRAFAEIAKTDPDLLLVIAGPDQEGWQATLQAEADRLGVGSRVVWTGMLSGDLKWGAFRSAEAFVLPSHQENFGIAVVEALACGLPVLISNKVNIWREIESDGVGLVEPDDQEGADRLLKRWQELSQEERREMSQRAVCSFERRFEIREAARFLIRTLKTLTDAPPVQA